jgi:hypothetical protein
MTEDIGSIAKRLIIGRKKIVRASAWSVFGRRQQYCDWCHGQGAPNGGEEVISGYWVS